jgi:hypothetical protein
MFDKLKRFKDPVRGTGLVVAVNHWGDMSGGGSGFCRMTLVVDAPGVPKTTVKYSKELNFDMWPSQGVELPITVDRADPEKVRVEWDEIQSRSDLQKKYEKREEQRLTDKAYGRTPTAAPGMPPGYEDVDPAALEFDPELKELLQAEMEASADPPAADDSGTAKDVTERLHELDELNASGALSDQEYQEQRNRIIQSI